MSATQSVTFTFSIIGCRSTKFDFTTFALNNKEKIPQDKYQFEFSINLNIAKEQNLITVNILSTLSKLESDKEKIATLESVNEFKILNLGELITETTDGILIPDPIIIQFFSISLSNTRGMYAVKLENSIYDNAIAPVMDISQFIPKKIIPVG